MPARVRLGLGLGLGLGLVHLWAPRLREVQKAVGQVVVRRDACEADVVRDGSAPRVRERARGSAALGGTAVHGRCMRDACTACEGARA